MSKPHFVADYERHVSKLKADHPLDKAMSLAVGGRYDDTGKLQCNVLSHAGLKDGMTVIDLGCGSGRTAKPLSERYSLDYLGVDVVPDLIEYAASVCPKTYDFHVRHDLTIPAEDSSADLVYAFSLFTHLLHEETYAYFLETKRVLKPNGTFVFSFLEFQEPGHWAVFQSSVDTVRQAQRPPLNVFLERSQIDLWCGRLGFDVAEYIGGAEPVAGSPFGQSLAICRN